MNPMNSRAAQARTTSIRPLMLAILCTAVALCGCQPATQQTATTSAAGAAQQTLSGVAQLGKSLYFDTSLSASGTMSCATCHDPNYHYGPPNDGAVQFGGPALDLPGARVAPEITYDLRNPNFSIGPDNPEQEGASVSQQAAAATGLAPTLKTAGGATSNALVPQGGLFWDGRANTLQEQTAGPLFNPVEMANHDIADLAARIANGDYADDFVKLFGANVLNNPQLLVSEAENAIARFEFEDASFHPYSSKYDYYLAGKEQLTATEMRGLQSFENPAKGNCAACHLDRLTADGRPPMFTDFQYEALGVPRNSAIAANADTRYYDLGLCGPFRTDLNSQSNYCGIFRTPSLRNVATRRVFFHNGVFQTLDQVLRFYALRDIEPAQFYPVNSDGSVDKFNDLPVTYRGNIDTVDVPFNRHPGDTPALNDDDIQDIIAFLSTLTDGYRPANAYMAGGNS